MDSYLHIAPSGIATTLKELHGTHALGVYPISMRFQFSPTTPAQFAGAQMLVEGRLSVAFAGRAPYHLAPLQLHHPVVFPSPEQGGQVVAHPEFQTDLSPEQLESLERERDGGPLNLHLDLQGTLLHPEQRESFWGSITHEVTASQWVKVLEELRYAQGFLIQVPRFDAGASPRSAAAAEKLEAAARAISDGRYREAVALARDVLETAYPDDPLAYPEELRPKFPRSKEADKALRFWWIRQALRLVTNAAKHADETTAEIEWERRDAVAAVAALAALVQRDPPA